MSEQEHFDGLRGLACNHKCHDPECGLNPWIEECPVCGCANPKFDPDAKSDIMPSEFWQLGF